MTNTPQQSGAGASGAGDSNGLEELRVQLEESRAEIRLLQQINGALVGTSSLDEVLQSIVAGLTATLGYSAATIWMLEDSGMSLVCRALAADPEAVARLESLGGIKVVGYRAPIFEESVIWPVVTRGETLISQDVAAVFSGFSQDDYLLSVAPRAAEAAGIASVIFVPLMSDGAIIGVLGVGSGGLLTDSNLTAVQRFAGQAGLAVEKARLQQQLLAYPEQLEAQVRERTRELEAVNRIAATVSRSLNLDTILKASLEKVLEVLELKYGAVFLTDERKHELNLMVQKGLPEDVVKEMQVTSIGVDCPGVVALKGEPILVGDFQAEPDHEGSPIRRHSEFRSMAGIPLESKGKVRGVLCLLSRKDNRFTSEDLKLLVTIGSEIGVAIENAWLYEKSWAHSKKMEELSMTDSLTALYNRRHFYRRLKEEMARAKRQRHPVSLLVVDLDNLKEYNDAHGHIKGDEALRGVAQAITASIRQDVDTGFRYGGDEFAVILPYSDSAEAGEVAERLRKTFEDFALEGTSLSIGLAELDFGEEVDDFVTRADTAMYVAKNSGGNRVYEAEKSS